MAAPTAAAVMATIIIELENLSRMWASLALQRVSLMGSLSAPERAEVMTTSAPTLTEVRIEFRGAHLVPPAAHWRTEDLVQGDWRRPQPPAGTATRLSLSSRTTPRPADCERQRFVGWPRPLPGWCRQARVAGHRIGFAGLADPLFMRHVSALEWARREADITRQLA